MSITFNSSFILYCYQYRNSSYVSLSTNYILVKSSRMVTTYLCNTYSGKEYFTHSGCKESKKQPSWSTICCSASDETYFYPCYPSVEFKKNSPRSF